MQQSDKHNKQEAVPKEIVVAEPSVLKELLFLLMKIATIVIVVVLLFTFMFGIHRNIGSSMYPAIKDADMVLFYRLNKEYVAKDILILSFEGEKQVCRVVATAGDTVDITEEGLVINGALQAEEQGSIRTIRYEGRVDFPITVAEGEVFVLADNRGNATDSRVYGAIRAEDTLGKAIMILRKRDL